MSFKNQENKTSALKQSIAIIGPTASGKSNLALALAKKINGEIIACDSVQVYKDFNIGSAKPTLEEQTQIPHHLIDLVSWKESFDAASYRTFAFDAINQIIKKNHTPIIVGGTGLYFRALCGAKFHDLPSDPSIRKELETWSNEKLHDHLKNLDPQRAKQLHGNDRFRLMRACEISMITGKTLEELSQEDSKKQINERPLTVLCNPSREDLLKNIELRSKTMLAQGFIDEVRNLLDEGCPEEIKAMQSIGYKQVCEFFNGSLSEMQLLDKIIIATRQYARKQKMWFRNVPIDLELNAPQDIDGCVQRIMKMHSQK